MQKAKAAPATIEPQAPGLTKQGQELPEKPDWIIGSTAELQWDKLVQDVKSSRTLHPADSEQIGIACEAWKMYMIAREDVDKNGMTFISQSGYPCPTPAYTAMKDWLKIYQNTLNKLGLNATARKGLKQNSYGVKAAVLSRNSSKARV